MFNSITCQIKKLDKDIDGCKERLNALKANHTKNSSKCCRYKDSPVRRSRSAMNRKKISNDKECENACKKHQKCLKVGNDKVKKGKEASNSPRNKRSPKIKQRSRSVSCARECDCTENQFHHNDLLGSKPEEQPKQKNSWANILKEHNRHNAKRSISNTASKGYSEYNKHVYPASIHLKNRGVQCTDSNFAPSKTNISAETGFTHYNPTRTLQFLLSEIRDNLKHKREDKVFSIMNDMEDAIYRIKSNQEYPTYEPKFNADFNIKPTLNNNLYSNQEMHKIFEDGFAKLETTCKTLEITCARLKEENNQLQLELQKKDGQILMLEKKDKDNLDKIDLLNKHIFMMNQKGDQYSQSIQDLTKLVNKLQQDNKSIEPLKEINAQLDSKICQLNCQKDGFIYENQLLKLENEKLKVLLDIKEKQLSNFKDVFLGFEDGVKKDVKVMQGRCVSEDSDPDSSAPLCSSPNTSGSMVAPVYGSWRGVSRVSSHADSICPSPPIVDRDFITKVGSTNYSPKESAQPLDIPVQLPLNVPPTKTNGLEDIRGQIKKMFTEHRSQSKTLENQRVQPQWTNLASIHSSVTSYNTTS